MGKFKGKVLLSEKKINAVIRHLCKNKDLTPNIREQLKLIRSMAVKYVHIAEREKKFYGMYEGYYPDIARNICLYFGASGVDLASCFRVGERAMDNWRIDYPEFDDAIRNGRKQFSSKGGWTTEYRDWFHPYFAHAFCVVFDATDEQIAHCFGICSEKFAEWQAKHPALSFSMRYGRKRKIFNKTLNQLKQSMKSRLGDKITSEDIDGILEKYEYSLYERGSIPAIADTNLRNTLNDIYRVIKYDFEKNKKDSPEQRAYPAGGQTLPG